jgi:centromeric protein E
MEQRDTVQSQLDNFRKVASDGNIDDRTTRRRVLIFLLLD